MRAFLVWLWSRVRFAGVRSYVPGSVVPADVATPAQWQSMVLWWVTEALRIADLNAALSVSNAALVVENEALRSESISALSELADVRWEPPEPEPLREIVESLAVAARLGLPVVSESKARTNGHH